MDDYTLRNVVRDGEQQIQLKCPGCGQYGDIDGDQFRGRVSIDCPDCEYHETVNLAKVMTSHGETDK